MGISPSSLISNTNSKWSVSWNSPLLLHLIWCGADVQIDLTISFFCTYGLRQHVTIIPWRSDTSGNDWQLNGRKGPFYLPLCIFGAKRGDDYCSRSNFCFVQFCRRESFMQRVAQEQQNINFVFCNCKSVGCYGAGNLFVIMFLYDVSMMLLNLLPSKLGLGKASLKAQ